MKFFSVLGVGFFIEARAEIIMPCTEKIDFLRLAHMIFSTGVWNSTFCNGYYSRECKFQHEPWASGRIIRVNSSHYTRVADV
jgi:hypothetical protein